MDVTELVRHIEDTYTRKVVLIYLRGSRMRGLHSANSDFDITALILPSIKEVLTGEKYSRRLQLPELNVEGNITTIPHFYTLLLKGSPNTIEMIFAKPIYVETSCQELATFLYGCRTELIQSRQLDFISSSTRMIRNNLQKSKALTYDNTESIRRRIMYAKLALLQCDVVAKGGNLDFCVPLESSMKNYVLNIDENSLPLEIDGILTQLKEKEKLWVNIKTQGTLSDLIFKKLEKLIFETIYKINEEIT